MVFVFLTILFSGYKKELGFYLLNEMRNENPYSGIKTPKYLDNSDTCKNWVDTSLPIKSLEFQKNIYGSLLISSVYYYDVIALETRSLDICEGNINADSMFYSTNHGIVKLSFTNGDKWDLESIEL